MIFYHNGAAIRPTVVRVGNTFIARASILEEDGESTSLGDLGTFANKDSAYQFALRSAIAFVEGQPMPLAPYRAEHK
jgi:hypothetical protein